MNLFNLFTTKVKKPNLVIVQPVKKQSIMNQPSVKYDVSNSSFQEKLDLLVHDDRFHALERSGTNTFKVTVCLWNGAAIQRMSFSSTKEDAVMWGLRSLNKLK